MEIAVGDKGNDRDTKGTYVTIVSTTGDLGATKGTATVSPLLVPCSPFPVFPLARCISTVCHSGDTPLDYYYY